MGKLESNKQFRRRSILDAAKQLLVEGGYDGLTTRRLAERAGLAVPTIYNLIGGKDEVLEALLSENVDRAARLLEHADSRSGLDLAEEMVERCIEVAVRDEAAGRATVIASDRVVGAYAAAGDTQAARSSAGFMAVEIATATVRAVQSGRALRGQVSAEALGEQVFSCFRDTLRDWGYGLVSTAEFRRRVLRGVYMVLCSDASEGARKELVSRINQLQFDAPALSSGSVRGGQYS